MRDLAALGPAVRPSGAASGTRPWQLCLLRSALVALPAPLDRSRSRRHGGVWRGAARGAWHGAAGGARRGSGGARRHP
jgi:hypothetical protein